MNLRKIALQLFIMLNFVTAVYAADFQQVQIKGPKDASDQYSGTIYGPIESSDTLWQISQRYRQNSGLSVYQVMQAIYELNPDAFEQQNINLLKDGSILKLPSERYIARVSNQQARQKADLDSQNLQNLSSNSSNGSSANSQNQSTNNNATLDETKELIEQKLGAIDEAQNRQFMAIRKQFAESISSVQSILDENKRLFERLDKVNTDIDEMRGQEQQKSLQMEQMGESIEELLEKSRQEDAKKAALLAEQGESWLNNPIMLILLFTLPVLLVLAAFAYWMIKRKESVAVTAEEDDIDDLSLDPLTAEMDDLSDALSNELSSDDSDDLDNDNLFGDDDLLDDVLAEELEESLDDALGDSIEEPLVDDSEIFDELGDDDLDNLLDEEEFEVGAEVVEQDDLDSLFDEDDELLSELDEELPVDSDEISNDDLLAKVSDGADNSDIDDMLIEEDEQQVESEADDIEYEEDATPDESLLAPVEVDEEQPEISIDELLEEPEDKNVASELLEDSGDINEEVLQNLDNEIASQNEELDNVTGSLIEELEQVEQMRSMMPDEEDELPESANEPQLDIQKYDGLEEDIDDDLLAENFATPDSIDADDDVEIDISEVLNETVHTDVDELLDVESQLESEDIAPSQEETELTDALVDIPQVAPASEEAEPVEAETIDEVEKSADVGSVQEASESAEADIVDEPTEIESVEDAAEPAQVESVDEALESTEAEKIDEVEESAELEPDDETAGSAEAVEVDKAANIESEVEAAEPTQVEPVDEVTESTETVDEVEEPAEQDPEDKTTESAEAVEVDEPADIESEEATEPAQIEPVDEVTESTAAAEESAEVEPDLETAESAETNVVDEREAMEPAEEATEAAQIEPVDEAVESAEAETIDEVLNTELDSSSDSDTALDEDQLEKALEDFEKAELDEVLEDLTSNESASISSLDDLEFSADDFVSKEQSPDPAPKQPKSLDDYDSIEDFDDSELDNAFDENFENTRVDSSPSGSDELDDLPGLGDWLDDDALHPSEQQATVSEDKEVLDELEESNFDEMLESIDLDEELSTIEDDDTGFDIAALLDETPKNEENNEIQADSEDFLDVEALLNESVGAESEDEVEKALDLDIPLEPFVNEFDNLEMIDVDADDGLGAKLDLAHAYIEIGEEESAKELLEEILQKGSPEQIAAARKVIDKLD
ncbi:FimV/HubP family polar landmark protein [Paraglaciecola arctica]|uniref:FimV/HubP family polar landmark protein n=1 Tax=Paraglaciecola arctica TaxID=1128911 RepID=UPI001C07EC15|nr:FimV/HubP family polar landmark protein [Paraglaciecola arctica]MBU3004060.1 pilus assembly protein FimV [Paraglaciecola arctica]